MNNCVKKFTRILLLQLAVFICIGCSMSPPEGQLECDDESDCPPDWICHTDDLCYSSNEAIANVEANDESGESGDNTDDSTDDTDTNTETDTDSDSDTE